MSTKDYDNDSIIVHDGKNYKLLDDIYNKQILLFNKVKDKSNILEIGTYMGHSLLIMLVSNPKINVTTIDLNDRYAKPVTSYLTSEFPDAKIEFIHNNSLNVIKKLKNHIKRVFPIKLKEISLLFMMGFTFPALSRPRNKILAFL